MAAASHPPSARFLAAGWPALASLQGRKAFTLVEMLMAMAVIVVLSALTLPAVMNIAEAQSLSVGTRMVSDMLILARSEAIAKHTLTRFTVVTTWPGNEEAAYRRMGIWYWDMVEEDFLPMTGWETLPDGILFEPDMPEYPRHAAYALKDPASLRGDYVLTSEDSKFTRRLQKKDVELQYVEFIATGAARLSGGTSQSSLFVITKGFQESPGKGPIVYTDGEPGRPKNWSQINLENLTGRVQIRRP